MRMQNSRKEQSELLKHGNKRGSACKEVFPLEDFSKNHNTKDGYWSTREADEPELICEYCNELTSTVFSIPCCQKRRLANEELPY